MEAKQRRRGPIYDRYVYLPLSGAARGANQLVCGVLLKVILLQVQQQQGEPGGQTVAREGERSLKQKEE